MFIMTCRLLGKSSRKPRKPIAFNLWSEQHPQIVQKALSKIPKKPGQRRHNVAAAVQVKRKLFSKQPRETQKKYEEMADEKHKALVDEWSFNLTRPASKDPVARQM